MRAQLSYLLLTILWLSLCITTYSQQDSTMFSKMLSLPDKVFSKIDQQSQKLSRQLEKQTEKYLFKLERQEQQLKRKLLRTDSVKAAQVFGDITTRYNQLKVYKNNTEPINNASLQNYLPNLDTFSTSIAFIKEKSGISNNQLNNDQLTSNLKNIKKLKAEINYAEYIRSEIRKRQTELTSQLHNTPLSNKIIKYKKQVYYYQAQLKEYKATLNNSKLLESKVVELAKKIPAFEAFFKKHSELSILFPAPFIGSPAASGFIAPGLQTRAQVMQIMNQQFGTSSFGSQQIFQQSVSDGQSHLNRLKNILEQKGGVAINNDAGDMPDFKPNNLKTKPFLQRLEFGTNFQTAKSRTYFPVTTDMALSIGYKVNSKSIVGISSSYKLGLGSGFNNIQLTHQGIGLRSFLDWKLKGSFWISGGYEQNYLSAFRRLPELSNRAVWKQSALIGISKVLDMKSTLFKKTKVQLLYDFLWKQQLPQTQAILFRVGYNF